MDATMRSSIAIIGGTGIGNRLALLPGKPIMVPTAEGPLRAKHVTIEGRSVYLLQRHSAGHKTPPHRVNYKAAALGCKALGIENVFATAAVGSLREDWGPGTFAACSDFLDLSFRRLTMWDREVKHIDFTEPFSPALRTSILESCNRLGVDCHSKAVYVCGDGPRYETPEEIQMYRKLGGDIVGMTASSEAIAFRELGIGYACLAIVTNLGSGLAGYELTHEEVVEVMESSGEKAVKILFGAIGELSHA